MAESTAKNWMVRIGNSCERSYRFTIPNFLTVWAGEPSSQRGLTSRSVSQIPFSRISLQFRIKISSALLMEASFMYACSS